MNRRAKLSEVLQYGAMGIVIICDKCQRPIDYVYFDKANQRDIDRIQAGELYETPESNLCWRCREGAG